MLDRQSLMKAATADIVKEPSEIDPKDNEIETIKWNLALLHNAIESGIKQRRPVGKEIEQFCNMHQVLDQMYAQKFQTRITSVEKILILPGLKGKDKQIFDTRVYLARVEREKKEREGTIYPEVNF